MTYLVQVFEYGPSFELFIPAFGLRGSTRDPKLIEKEARRIIESNANSVRGFRIELRSGWSSDPFVIPN